MSDDLGMLLRTASYLAFEDGTNDYTTPALAAARIAKLEAALQPFVEQANYFEKDDDSESACVFVGDLRKARAALAGGKDE